MKKLNILFIAIVSMIFTSCDSFTDIKPVGKVIPTTQQDYRDLLTYAYEIVPGHRSMASIRGDELQLIADGWGDYEAYESIFIWEDANPNESTVSYPWQQFYKSILQANLVILEGENATKSKGVDMDQLRAEAYFMRAYMHFGIANMYSDVYNAENMDKKSIPLATKIDIWQNYDRNTVAEVYKQITDDIDAGLKLFTIDEQPKGYNYRFSKVSAYGIAARVYLYMGEWKQARDYAKMAYDINNTLIDLNADEAVLPVKFNSDENVLAIEQTFKSRLKRKFNVSEKLINSFDKENDKRFAKYFEVNGDDYRCILGYDDENKVSMRTSEFYLMLAEAEAKMEGGNLTTAKQYLKDLIVKRLTPEFNSTEAAAIDAMDKNAFIERVAEERFRELACQGFRWFDLRRYGKHELTKDFNGNSFTLEEGDPRFVIPFPKEAVENNPNLRQ